MTKLQFLLQLNDILDGLPEDEVEARLNFFTEMIEDRMEEGLSEEDSVASVGSIEEIATQIAAEIPITKPIKKKNDWQSILLAVGGLVWVPLLIGAIVVAFSLYVSLCVVIISLWSVFASLVGSGLGLGIYGIVLLCGGDVYAGLVAIASSLVCAGLAIFQLYGCKEATRGTGLLGRKMIFVFKKSLFRREAAK